MCALRRITDHLGRNLEIPSSLDRVISVVPSLTELLFSLGLEREISAITKFCIHPKEMVYGYRKIGGTKNLQVSAILDLNPQLIIANKEENDRQQINQLAEKVPVWVSDIRDLPQALKAIMEIGYLVNRKAVSGKLVSEIKKRFRTIPVMDSPPRALYMIWRKPYMAAGVDTFIHNMMTLAGLENILKVNRYPQLSMDDLLILDPQVILLSSEPYPFKNQHVEEIQGYFPAAKVLLVDGEMFSWYGSRLLKVPAYFQSLRDHL